MKYLVLLLFFQLSISNSISAQEANNLYHYTTENDQIAFYLNQSNLQEARPILTIPTDKDFLAIGRSTPKVKEVYGFFKFKEKYSDYCKSQIIDTIIQSKKGIEIQGELCNCKYQVQLLAKDSSTLHLNINLSDSSYNRIQFTYLSTKSEAIYGLGEQYTHSNLKGQKIPIWVEEQGIGAGDQPITGIANFKIAGGTPVSTYAPIPFYISSHNYSFLLKNTSRAVFDLSKQQQIKVEVWDNYLEATLNQKEAPLDLIEDYTLEHGRHTALPNWAYGTIVGLQGGSDIVTAYVDSLEASGSKISAIWIQDWVGRRRTFVGDQLRWYWQADENRYPNFKAFCQKMKARGIAVLGYINPMLTNDGELYEEADKKGYLVKNHNKETYVIQMTGFKVGLIDLSNPEACTWIKNIVKNNMIVYGLDGWMADFGEALPWDAVLYSGESAETYHNQYPVHWAKVNREAIEEAGKLGEVAFFSRSSFTDGSQYSTFYWAGDQMTSWQKNDGLRSIIPALTSSGISGMAINHADVGAFAGFWKFGGIFSMRRGRLLLKRHIELGAFTPIFRTHEGIIPKRNKQVYSDPDIRAFYAKFSTIREQLRPYLKAVAEEAINKGYPMVRHLYLFYPNDLDAQKARYQFLLGEDLLVAPKLKKHGKRVKVYLPKGDWQHLFSQKVYKGRQYYRVKAKLGTPPVFVKTTSVWKETLLIKDSE